MAGRNGAEPVMTMAEQIYDPYRLVEDVVWLLRDRGLEPEPVDIETRAARITGACLLLRGLNVTPAMPPEDALDLNGGGSYSMRLHGD
jgi:hypothetical protein